MLKKTTQSSLLLLSFVLCSLFIFQLHSALAVNVWWDNNGISAATSGIWDTTSNKWSLSTNLTASTVAYTNGNFPEFTAGGNTTVSAITMTVNSAVTCAGMATGINTNSGTTVTT